MGVNSLIHNTSGKDNSALGYQVLLSNTTGTDNTGFGFNTLRNNTTGQNNNATGLSALSNNTQGSYNTAIGGYSLFSNTTGMLNIAAGLDALDSVTTGTGNIGLGTNAGTSIIAGSHNIDLGGNGTSDESYTIRIGDNTIQKTTYIAGISAANILSGNTVEVGSDGQLGVTLSAARYKRDLRDMGVTSTDLMKLRPVTFDYRMDHTRTRQFGLVAEDVAKVYPELVTRSADGRIQSVRYLELTSMLLNELQKRTRASEQQQQAIQKLKLENRKLAAQNGKLAAQLVEVRTENARELNTVKDALNRLSAVERTVHAMSTGPHLDHSVAVQAARPGQP